MAILICSERSVVISRLLFHWLTSPMWGQHFNHSLLKMYFFTCSVVISAGLNSVEKGGPIASSMQRGHSRSSIHSVPVSGALNDGRARRLAGLSITRFFMAAPASETADRLMKTK